MLAKRGESEMCHLFALMVLERQRAMKMHKLGGAVTPWIGRMGTNAEFKKKKIISRDVTD